MPGTGRRERLCAFTVGVALLEISTVICDAVEARRAGDRDRLLYIKEIKMPRLGVLLGEVDVTCPGVRAEALKGAREWLDKARGALERACEEPSPDRIDDFVTAMFELREHLLASLAER